MSPTVSLRHLGKIGIATALLALAAACASTSGYRPASGSGIGYSDQQLDNGRYRITYEGNSSTSLSTVENYVLLRAAEVTLANGHDYFVVLDSNTESMRRFVTTGTSFGRGGFGRRGFFYGSGFGRGFGGGFGSDFSTTRERLRYSVGTIIEIRRGDKPAGDSTAYDARQIINNVGPAVARPDGR